MKIFSIHSKHDFIEPQLSSLKKNLKEDFELVIFNNAKFSTFNNSSDEHEKINEMCRTLGLKVIEVLKDQEIIDACESIETICTMFDGRGMYSNPNVAAAYPVCWAWQRHIGKEKGLVCFIHSDVFLIRESNFSDLLSKYDLCFNPQFRVGAHEYIWETLVLMNMEKLPNPGSLNWYCGKVNGIPVDVGGQTGHYLKAHPNLKILRFQLQHFEKDDQTDFQPSDYELFSIEGELPMALHYRSGSNWNRRTSDYHEKKMAWLKKQI